VRVMTRLFGLGAVIFAIIAVVYGTFFTDWDEPVGTAGLLLLAGMAALIAAYLWFTERHVDPQPEDDPFGEIAEGAGELGEFAPYSWWPMVAAGGGALVFGGAAFGIWLMLIGGAIGALGLIGWVTEFYRGGYSH
jgi:hypothetical protein